MKTFQEFLFEASTTQRLKLKTIEAIKKHRDNPEKLEVYKTLLKKIRERQSSLGPDYPGREAARRDKTLIPSERTSSFPELVGIETKTKNPRKLRKQKAIGEIIDEHCGCDDNAVKELESGLKKLKNTSYDSIDELMRSIMKKHKMTAKELHNAFIDTHGKIPDEWIKQINKRKKYSDETNTKRTARNL